MFLLKLSDFRSKLIALMTLVYYKFYTFVGVALYNNLKIGIPKALPLAT